MDLTLARNIFSSLSITQICDAAETIRVLDHGIKPYTANARMLGKALTVKTDGDLLPVLKALQRATDNEVLVIHSGHSPYALAGDIFASEAKRKNLAGFVIDGFCRDTESLAKIGLPFYARGICPKACPKKKLGEFNVPLECGGVLISPGDVLIGDEHGVVAVSMDELPVLLNRAAEIAKREERVLAQIRAGHSLFELVNFDEHYAKLEKGEESTFQWK